MNTTANKSCLQRPKSQTMAKNDFYMPHMKVKSARKNCNSESYAKEKAEVLRKFVCDEEREINRRFSRSITGDSGPVYQKRTA